MVRRNSLLVTPKSLRAYNEVCKICWSRLGCLKLGQDNPGSVWNLISDLKALKGNSRQFCLSTIWWLDVLKRIGKCFWILGIKKPQLTFNRGLLLISLHTTRPRTGRRTSVSDRGAGTCFLTSNSLVTWLFKNPDISHIETFIWKKEKKLNWFIDISHNHKEHSRTQNLGPVLQTPISANPGLTLKPLRVTNI